jgi:hypothetical protein
MTQSEDSTKKKISLQDMVKQQLANKKNQTNSGNSGINGSQATKKLKSQSIKKVNNQRKRTGV